MNFFKPFSAIGSLVGRAWQVVVGEQASPPVQATRSNAGVIVTPERALSLSTVFACCSLPSRIVSTMPCNIYEIDANGNRRIARDHELQELLSNAPNANMTAPEFWEFMIFSRFLTGNAYAPKRTIGKRVVAIDVWLPQFTTPYLTKAGLLRYRYDDGKRHEDLPGEDVLHLKGASADGLVGLSPIEIARQSLGHAIALEQAAGSTFRNALMPSGIFKFAQFLKKDQRSDFRRALRRFEGAKNAGRAFLLEGGIDFQGIQMKPTDVEMLASRNFSVEELCRWFEGTPPQLIGHTDKASSWASSLENTTLGYAQFNLRPLCHKTEKAITRSLIRPEERSRYYAKFNFDALLRADAAGRALLYSAFSQNGIKTRNELRALEDMDPLPGGDVLTVQSNMIPLADIGKVQGSDAQQAKAALKQWLGLLSESDNATETERTK